MRDEHTVICSPAVFELISPDASAVPVKVDLTYHSRDPYAVQASFRTGRARPVDWVFARDLLPMAWSARRAPATSGCSRCRRRSREGPAGADLRRPVTQLFTTCATRPSATSCDRTYEAVPRELSTPGSTSTWRSPSCSQRLAPRLMRSGSADRLARGWCGGPAAVCAKVLHSTAAETLHTRT